MPLASTDDKCPELRPALWPAAKLPVPTVLAGPVLLSGSGFLAPFEDGAPSVLRPVAVTDEFYLRELPALDLADAQGLREFTRKHGALFSRNLWRVLGAADTEGRLEEDTSNLRDREADLREQALNSFVDLAIQFRDAASKKPEFLRAGIPSSDSVCHIDEIRWTVALLRDMVRVWVWQQGKLPFATVQKGWESPVRPNAAATQAWPSESQALRMLEATLNLGLGELRPAISLVGAPEPNSPQRESVGLFAAVCIQFANHIVEKAAYKRCDNCGQWFVRQSGRAEQGQHRRSGVKYCSRGCARAKAERDRYARRRSESSQRTSAKAHQGSRAEGGKSA